MFGLLKLRRPVVYEQWLTPLLEFRSDTAGFYKAVEEGLDHLEVPELVTERLVFRDGGFLSAGREYLRVRRELLVFDILSAPFGKCWWFSCRSAFLPRTLRWWEVFVFLLFLASFVGAYWYSFGMMLGGIALSVTLIMLLVMMVAARTWNGLDDLLLKLPVLGAFYEAIFRAESYYRDDARRMYVSIVDHLVREKVKEFALAGGVEEVGFNQVSDISQVASFLDRAKAFVSASAPKVSKASSK